jgi:membrane-associated PAP2 superfamily phosphatase
MPGQQAALMASAGGFLLLILLCAFPSVDLALSALCYDPTRLSAWYLKQASPWRELYQYGELPAYVMAVGAGLMLVLSQRFVVWQRYRRHCLVLVLAVALGPGLLVNGLLKPLWGRPRPRHIEQFAGIQPYRPWWQPGVPGQGESFPSGHAAMGYILIAGTGLVPCRRRVWPYHLLLGTALGYGTLIGVARVMQGGHFASDVFWAGFLMCITVGVLQKALGGFLHCPGGAKGVAAPTAEA